MSKELKSVEQAAKKLIEIMEKGVNPWVKPWKESNKIYNPVSKKPFTGFNFIMLSLFNTYSTGYFITFSQCQQVGGNVKKGEKGLPVLLPIIAKDKENPDITVCYGFKEYYVFNLDQCENVSSLYPNTTEKPENRIESCENTIKNTKATINHVQGDGCYYMPSSDSIVLEPFQSFENVEKYYATAFHELSHWTGHESRLNRSLHNTDKYSYAFEELVAELSANMLCNHHGIDSIDSHNASYLKSWIGALKEDSTFLLKACGNANKAYQYIANHSESV